MICMRCRQAEVDQISSRHYRCSICGHMQWDDGSPCLLGDYEDVYGDDRPEGCRVCDSDNYPMCKKGCPMIDD